MWDLDIRERSCICPFFDRTSHRCSTGTCAGSFLHIGLVDTLKDGVLQLMTSTEKKAGNSATELSQKSWETYLAGTLAHLVQSDTCMYHRVDRKDSRHSRTSDGSEVRRWSSCTMTHTTTERVLFKRHHSVGYSYARMTYSNRHSNDFYSSLNIRIRIIGKLLSSHVYRSQHSRNLAFYIGIKILKNRLFESIQIQVIRKLHFLNTLKYEYLETFGIRNHSNIRKF